MAKKIKFPLSMKNDAQVRDLDELREHFDLDKAIGYFLDGKLLSWLEARYYDTEADAVRALNKDNADVPRRLCEIFDVEYHAEEAPKIDVEAVEERNRRLGELKQYTSDLAVLEKVDQVAFTQEELADLIDEGYSDIYLCNNSFVIPLRVRNKHYIGIGKAEAVIRSQERVDFEELGIRFDDVKFDEAYETSLSGLPTSFRCPICKASSIKFVKDETDEDKWICGICGYEKLTPDTPGDWYKKGREAEDKKDYAVALDYFRKAAEANHRDSLFKLGWFYSNGYGVTQDYQESMRWYQKAADLGDMWAMNNIGVLHENGQGVTQNYQEAKKWYEKAADLGNSMSMKNIGGLYYYGKIHVHTGTFITSRRSMAGHNPFSWYSQPMQYYREELVDQSKDYAEAYKWYKKAADAGNSSGMKMLGVLYENGHGVFPNNQEALNWYKKSLEAGNTEAQTDIDRINARINPTTDSKWYNPYTWGFSG